VKSEYIIVSVVALVALVGLVINFTGGSTAAFSYRVAPEVGELGYSGLVQGECFWDERTSTAVCPGSQHTGKSFSYGAPQEILRGGTELRSFADFDQFYTGGRLGPNYVTPEFVEDSSIGKRYYYTAPGQIVEIEVGRR